MSCQQAQMRGKWHL